MIRYAQVVVPVPLKAEFTYSFDSDQMDIVPGIRVIVPFGTRRKNLQGYVISVSDSKPEVDFEIKQVKRAVDTGYEQVRWPADHSSVQCLLPPEQPPVL